MIPFSTEIQQQISQRENRDKAKWLENYVKHDIQSLGVGIPEIRDIIRQAEREHRLTQLPISEQTEMLNDLMRQPITEYKLAAILFVQLYWKTSEPDATMRMISGWFDQRWISDWNVCDWLCVRLLSPLVDTQPTIIDELSRWNTDPYLWKARASLVPFAQCKSIGQHREMIAELSKTLIQRDERFCKTAVGWVMREYSKIDPLFVTDFLEKYQEWTTTEVIKNARKYM